MITWILLRGLTREKRHWGPFPERLGKDWPDARIVTLELPGNGELNTLESPLTIEEMAIQCRIQLGHLGIPPPYHLLALSMGAMVATAWASAHPEEIAACVLVNTSFSSFSPLHHRLRPGVWPALLRLLLTRSERKREEAILSLTSHLEPAGSTVIDDWVAIARSRPVRPWNALRQLLASARYLAPPGAPVPTLVMVSEKDGLVDPRCSEEIARRWHCATAVHPTAGHDLPLDDPNWVAGALRAWFERITASA